VPKHNKYRMVSVASILVAIIVACNQAQESANPLVSNSTPSSRGGVSVVTTSSNIMYHKIASTDVEKFIATSAATARQIQTACVNRTKYEIGILNSLRPDTKAPLIVLTQEHTDQCTAMQNAWIQAAALTATELRKKSNECGFQGISFEVNERLILSNIACQPGLGGNLVQNSSFSDQSAWTSFGIDPTLKIYGSISSAGTLVLNAKNPLIYRVSGFRQRVNGMIPGRKYGFSYKQLLDYPSNIGGECLVVFYPEFSDGSQKYSGTERLFPASGLSYIPYSMQYVRTFTLPNQMYGKTVTGMTVEFNNNSQSCEIDDVVIAEVP
jgi:hypothetical protein